MKSWVALCCLLLLSSVAQADIGTFFVLKSAYLYKNVGGDVRVLTRQKKAYPVVQVKEVGKEKLLFQIQVNSKRIHTGTGFVVQTDAELQAQKGELVKLYVALPQTKAELAQYQWVRADTLLATGRQERSPVYPELDFRAVTYKGTTPRLYWVDHWAGVYRPDKDAGFLNLTWDSLEQEGYGRAKRKHILMGLVELGYTKAEVKLALGAPNKEEGLPGGALQWVYPQKKVIFEKGKVSRTR